jgi:hypothetical protein
MKRLLRLLTVALFIPAVLAAESIDWDSAKSLYPGIRMVKLKRTSPRLIRMAIMRIDLSTPGLTFVTTGRDADWGKPMPDYPKLPIRTRRTTTMDFMRKMRAPAEKGGRALNVVVAFNASPWRPWTKPYNHKYADPPGVNISDGVVVGNRGGKNPALVIYKDGKVDIVDKISKEDFPKIKDALSGFYMVARDGKVLPDMGPAAKQCHPRTAYGLSQDRRYLYVIVIDGRQKHWSLGAKGSETGAFLLEAGADDVINMDGGGSTTMCYWDRRKNRPVMVNHQGHGFIRPVANNLGIILNTRKFNLK